jgi:hypothetical protein
VEKPGERVGDNQEGSETNCRRMEKAHAQEKPPGRGAEMIIYINYKIMRESVYERRKRWWHYKRLRMTLTGRAKTHVNAPLGLARQVGLAPGTTASVVLFRCHPELVPAHDAHGMGLHDLRLHVTSTAWVWAAVLFPVGPAAAGTVARHGWPLFCDVYIAAKETLTGNGQHRIYSAGAPLMREQQQTPRTVISMCVIQIREATGMVAALHNVVYTCYLLCLKSVACYTQAAHVQETHTYNLALAMHEGDGQCCSPTQ